MPRGELAMKQFLFDNSIDGLRVHFDRQPISNSDLIGNICIIENGNKYRKATVQIKIKSDNVYQYKKKILAVMVGDIILFCGLVKKIEQIDAENSIFKVTGEFKS